MLKVIMRRRSLKAGVLPTPFARMPWSISPGMNTKICSPPTATHAQLECENEQENGQTELLHGRSEVMEQAQEIKQE